MRSNQAVLLADVFDDLNAILLQHGKKPQTKAQYIHKHLQNVLTSNLNTLFIKSVQLPRYLLLRTGCDLHHALYCALVDSRSSRQFNKCFNRPSQSTSTPTSPSEEHEELVLTEMNRTIHEQIQVWVNRGQDSSTLCDMKLQEEIEKLNPRLWNMVWKLTTPKHGSTIATTTPSSRSRHLPCLFILAAIAHAAHPPCNYPLHLTLTDYIDSQSGSSELLQVLSRFGICVSRDTFQRHKTAVIVNRRQEGMQGKVLSGAFCIASIDNIDRLAPGKKITTRNDSRGFHGTSIQHVAPKPRSCQLTPGDVPEAPMITVPPDGLFSSPFTATSVLPRTTHEGQRPEETSTAIQLPEQITQQEAVHLPGSEDVEKLLGSETTRYQLTWYREMQGDKRPLSSAAVLISDEEQEAIVNLDKQIFAYMCKRHSALSTNMKLPGLKDFLMRQLNETDQLQEKSTITTLGVLPDCADNINSLKSILDNLHDLYGIGTQMSWLPVIGDQKIFAHLQKLKRHYGRELDWLIPFPGDWHMMKNFQPVLMKLYFHAGVLELAIESGYKGANLTALETNSTFKHTHLFLLEAFEACFLHAITTYLEQSQECISEQSYDQFAAFWRA